MRVVAIKMPEELVAEVDRYAYKHNLSRSEVVRLALEEFLSRHRPARGLKNPL
jgi:metal-responsive CopG/Arc/MetJ family transcriptional regulator